MDAPSISAGVALGLAVMGIIGWGLRWGWKVLRRVSHFLDDYNGQPARDGMPARPGFMARLTTLEVLIQHVVDETKPNHGSSLRDSLNRLERDVGEIKTEQAAVKMRLQIYDAGKAAP